MVEPFYTGKRRTFRTSLAVPDCVQRLRDDVREPLLPTWKIGGYMPLAAARDTWMLRKVEGQRFTIFIWPYAPEFAWYFYGEIGTHAGHTMITGQYRLDWWSTIDGMLRRALLPLAFGGLFFFTLWLFVGGDVTIWEMLGIVGMLAGAVAVVLWSFRTANTDAQANEARIVAVLQQVCEAEEVAPAPDGAGAQAH
jgi:hypothetical protein